VQVDLEPQPGPVVVTGAAGNLGSGVVARLMADGVAVRPVVQHASQLPDAPAGAVAVELTDAEATLEALRGADSVIHLAAMPSPSAGPGEVIFANNALSVYHVLQAARSLRLARVILASSVSAYGLSFAPTPWSPRFAPITEDHDLLPSDPYGLSKQVNEVTAAAFVRATPLPVVILRLHWIATRDQQLARVERDRTRPEAGARELWGYVDRDDAIEVVVRSLGVREPGLHVVNVSAPDTIHGTPTETLLRDHHPTTELRASLPGHTSPWSSQRCAELLGYAPSTSWRTEPKGPPHDS